MKKAFLTTLTMLMAYNFIIFGTIIETPHFSDLNDHVTPQTLVILDIDHTLLIPAQTLGNDVWFTHRWEQYQKANISKQEALELALADWEGIRHLTKVNIVEEGSDKIVRLLQDAHITVMGLTTQGLALATRTVQQLANLNINLSLTAPSKDDYYFMNGQGVLYRKGILFTSGTVKGTALLHLLDHLGYAPKRIVFINDKEKHLKDIEDAVISRNIEFIGLRYSYSDARVNAFRPEIAEIQWKYSSFAHILSDAEAEQLLD
jgi:hypothetical protein